jgi:hypothetical protein
MLGKLQIIQYAIPTSATLSIPLSMQVQGTLTLVERSPVAAAVQIGFCRNYTQQPSLGTSLPDEHKQIFATEWVPYTTPVDQATQTAYSLYADPVMEQKVPHPTYRVELTPAGMRVQLGEARNLFGDRYQLQNGKSGQVTSLTTDFGLYSVIAEITV